MSDSSRFFENRPIRRALIIALIVVIVAVEWVLEPLTQLVHRFIVFVGLRRLEDWLRGQPLWFAAIPIAFAGGIFLFFEFYQYVVLAQGHYLLFLLFHVLKWTAVPVLNYVLGLYHTQLLAVFWIRRGYAWYRWNRRWFNRQVWVKRVLAVKKHFKTLVKERWVEAREVLKARFTRLRKRRSAWAAAHRMRRVRNKKM